MDFAGLLRFFRRCSRQGVTVPRFHRVPVSTAAADLAADVSREIRGAVPERDRPRAAVPFHRDDACWFSVEKWNYAIMLRAKPARRQQLQIEIF